MVDESTFHTFISEGQVDLKLETDWLRLDDVELNMRATAPTETLLMSSIVF